MKAKLIVIGISAGGLSAFKYILPRLTESLRCPIVVVQHRSKESEDEIFNILNKQTVAEIKVVDDKMKILPQHIYFAPSDHHVLVEPTYELTLCTDIEVTYARPSIDVLFESAADAFMGDVISIIMTGANFDGTKGCLTIKKAGGVVIAQKPETAYSATMPQSVIESCEVDAIVTLEEIPQILNKVEWIDE